MGRLAIIWGSLLLGALAISCISFYDVDRVASELSEKKASIVLADL